MTEKNEQKRLKVKQMIENGGVENFGDIVLLTGPTALAKLLGSNTDRIKDRLSKPQNFRYEEIRKLATYFEVSRTQLFELVDRQYELSTSRKKNRSK